MSRRHFPLRAILTFGVAACTSRGVGTDGRAGRDRLAAEASASGLGRDADSIVVSMVQRFLGALRDRDTTALRAVLHPSMSLGTSIERDGRPIVMALSASQLVETVSKATGLPWNQQLRQPKVSRDGGLAAVWSEYVFYRGTELDHCGVIAIHLALTATGWTILHIADTHRSQCNGSRLAP